MNCYASSNNLPELSNMVGGAGEYISIEFKASAII